MIEEAVWGKIIKDYIDWDVELIKRDIQYEIPKVQRALSIVGPRRAGKTYFMFQISKELEKTQTVYVNFEDPRLVGADIQDLMKFLDAFYSIFPENVKKTNYFLLDEIQNIEGWERFVRYLLDKNQKVIISGSSSKMLSREISTELRGRAIVVNVYPFSFKETLKANGLVVEKYLSTYEESKIKKLTVDYLIWGAYPEVVLNPSLREEILKENLNLTIYRDIVERWRVANIKALRLIVKMLAHSPNLSITKIYNNLKGFGIEIGKTTVANYLEYLMDSMIFYKLYPYIKSYKKQEMLGFKSYLIDNGLLTILGVEDKSRLLENIVISELIKRGYEVNQNLFYYLTKDGREIDFLIKDRRGFSLIETAYDIDEEHIRRMFRALEELDSKKGIVITWNKEDILEKNHKIVEVMPLWKWLIASQERNI